MRGGDPEEGADSAGDGCRAAPASRSSSARRSPLAARPSSTAGSRWSARTATISCCACAGLPVKGYASHGESWSVALALRLASAELLRAESRLGDPVLILDDVFAELDTDRRARLAELVARTTSRSSSRPRSRRMCPPALRARIVRVEAGTILEAADA